MLGRERPERHRHASPIRERSIWPEGTPCEFGFKERLRRRTCAPVLLSVAGEHGEVVWILGHVYGDDLSPLERSS